MELDCASAWCQWFALILMAETYSCNEAVP